MYAWQAHIYLNQSFQSHESNLCRTRRLLANGNLWPTAHSNEKGVVLNFPRDKTINTVKYLEWTHFGSDSCFAFELMVDVTQCSSAPVPPGISVAAAVSNRTTILIRFFAIDFFYHREIIVRLPCFTNISDGCEWEYDDFWQCSSRHWKGQWFEEKNAAPMRYGLHEHDINVGCFRSGADIERMVDDAGSHGLHANGARFCWCCYRMIANTVIGARFFCEWLQIFGFAGF